MIRIRPFEAFDEPFLAHFLCLAAHEEEVETVLANPELAIYIDDWGRAGDCGVVAEDVETRTLLGMAWVRFWTPDRCGFGWMDEITPELVVAVEGEFRGQGLGRQLIEALKCRLRALQLAMRWDVRHQRWVLATQAIEVEQPEMKGPPCGVALNVREESPAVRLYERLGFATVEGSAHTNRMGGTSFNMLASLQQGNWRAGRMDRSINTNWAGAPREFVSVEHHFGLRLDLFTRQEQERFIQFMSGLPGAGEGMWKLDGIDGRTAWSYFGPAPVKAAIHGAHLFAYWSEGKLRVRGDLHWKQWCEWDDAFQGEALWFPHELLITWRE